MALTTAGGADDPWAPPPASVGRGEAPPVPAPAAGQPWHLAPPVRERLVTRSDLVGGLSLAVGLVLLGAPVGILWASITPRAALVAVGEGRIGLADVEDKAFVAQDGTFALLTLAVGLLAGVLVWSASRRWSVGGIVGGVAGAFGAAAVALKAGQVFDERLGTFGDGSRTLREGVPLTLPNALLQDTSHSWWLVLALPAGLALSFAVLTYWRGARTPGPYAAPTPYDPQLSSATPASGRSPGWGPPAGPAAGPPPA